MYCTDYSFCFQFHCCNATVNGQPRLCFPLQTCNRADLDSLDYLYDVFDIFNSKGVLLRFIFHKILSQKGLIRCKSLAGLKWCSDLAKMVFHILQRFPPPITIFRQFRWDRCKEEIKRNRFERKTFLVALSFYKFKAKILSCLLCHSSGGNQNVFEWDPFYDSRTTFLVARPVFGGGTQSDRQLEPWE